MANIGFDRFPLTTEECELLLAFARTSGIDGLSKVLRKDRSVISRMLARIYQKHPVLEKRRGKWVLTPLGQEINLLSRDHLLRQRARLLARSSIVLGSTREFGTRVLAARLNEITSAIPNSVIHIKTFEAGIEEALHSRLIDIGFDCGRPEDPDIAYRLCTHEPIVAVCTPGFLKQNKVAIDAEEFSNLPFLLCERLSLETWMGIPGHSQNLAAVFNDVGATRSACLEGFGWAVLPRYCIQDELNSRRLTVIGPRKSASEHYGVWWRKSDKTAQGLSLKLIEWLKKVNL